MIHAGSIITKGRAIAVVTTVISQKSSELGDILYNISKEIKKQEKIKTPLQITLNKLAKYFAIGFLVTCVLISILGYVKGESISNSILHGLTLAFATIPEELPILIKSVLAIGAFKLSKRFVFVKDLKSAEYAGSVTQFLCDKTGTMTTNRLSWQQILISDALISDFEVVKMSKEHYLPVIEAW